MTARHGTEPDDEPPRRSEADIRHMLEQSRRDIAEGHTVPLAPVLDRMQATAEQVRRDRRRSGGADRPSA